MLLSIWRPRGFNKSQSSLPGSSLLLCLPDDQPGKFWYPTDISNNTSRFIHSVSTDYLKSIHCLNLSSHPNLIFLLYSFSWWMTASILLSSKQKPTIHSWLLSLIALNTHIQCYQSLPIHQYLQSGPSPTLTAFIPHHKNWLQRSNSWGGHDWITRVRQTRKVQYFQEGV